MATKTAAWFVASLAAAMALILLFAVGYEAFRPRETHRPDSVRVHLATLAGGLDNFKQDVGRYPRNIEGLAALTTAPEPFKSRWKGPYITKPVGLDPWGHPYVYQLVEGQGPAHYVLTCYGSDGEPGGEGDAGDIVVTGP